MVEMFWQLFDLLSPHFFTLIRFTSAPSSPTAQPRRTGACGPETSSSASMEYQSRANLTSRFWSWWPTPPATATSCSQSAGGWHTQVAPLPLLSSQNPAGRQPLTGSFDVKSFSIILWIYAGLDPHLRPLNERDVSQRSALQNGSSAANTSHWL